MIGIHTQTKQGFAQKIIVRQFNIEVQFVKSVNYTFEQSL